MKIHEQFNLSQVLWYKIGGTARYFIECDNKKDIEDAFKYIQQEKAQKYFVCGLGANLLFTDDYFDGAVIQITSNPHTTPLSARDGIKLIGRNIIEAYAGETLDSVIQFAFQHNLTGLEWAGGLPGTVGAAIRGNVGAFGGEIKDTFAGAEILRIGKRGLKKVTATRKDIKFSYRSSTVKLHKNLIVVSAQFKLKKATMLELSRARQTYLANIEYRKRRHPLEYPNTGSVFKNISKKDQVEKILEVFPDIKEKVTTAWHGKVSVGYLVKRLDLSGFRVGNAEISQKHSNFIINLGNAKFTDVLTIIRKIENTFENTFGFTPEAEVEIVA